MLHEAEETIWKRRWRIWRFSGAAIAALAAFVLLGASAEGLILPAVGGYLVGDWLLSRRVRQGHYR